MDTDLVTRAQGGDQEAFADLGYAIADRSLAVSHRILSDIDLAEDATQQAQHGYRLAVADALAIQPPSSLAFERVGAATGEVRSRN